MIGAIDKTMERISVATPHSPIAVFKTTNQHDKPALLSVFADTVETRRMISTNELPLVGVFDGGQDMAAVKKLLLMALR